MHSIPSVALTFYTNLITLYCLKYFSLGRRYQGSSFPIRVGKNTPLALPTIVIVVIVVNIKPIILGRAHIVSFWPHLGWNQDYAFLLCVLRVWVADLLAGEAAIL